jgi:hypothetical protein
VKSQSVEDVERYRAARDPRQTHFDFYLARTASLGATAPQNENELNEQAGNNCRRNELTNEPESRASNDE